MLKSKFHRSPGEGAWACCAEWLKTPAARNMRFSTIFITVWNGRTVPIHEPNLLLLRLAGQQLS
jgi:hypothetical protein